MTHTEYNTLFKNIAISNKLIAHTDDKPAFFRMISSGSPFPMMQIKEFLVALQSTKAHPPFILLESFNHTYQEDGAEHHTKHIHGSFCIIDKADVDSFDNEETTITNTETIAAQILSYLENYFIESNKPAYFDLEGISGEKIARAGSGGYCGTRQTFTIVIPATQELNYDASQWQ